MAEQYLSLSLFITFLIHCPFGFYGARFERFSRPWGRCLYIPILITIILRRYLEIAYEFIPYFILLALIGQLIGKRLGRRKLSVEAECR